jgi:hydrogenase maturation protein HypF
MTNELSEMPLVMTSGNRTDEPIAIDDADALNRLGEIADAFLIHDRPIQVRCDDSVVRVIEEDVIPVRRSRGYAPAPIALPFACASPILALGGQLKVTFAVGRGRNAFLSHHLGDLDQFSAYQAFVNDIRLFESLFFIEPEIVVHDLHPDYASTRYARERVSGSASSTLPTITSLPVQHHHAHVASCMAENGLTEPVIGVALDGSGYGTDGSIWGGEFFVGTYLNLQRVAHLRYVGMPGGEAAIREPWRMAVSHAIDAGRASLPLNNRIPGSALQTVGTMLKNRFHCPPTSSAGRLFDAVSSLAGIRDRVSFEGQAAMELEALAAQVKDDNGCYPFALADDPQADNAPACLIIDTRPLICSVIDDVEQKRTPERIARRFQTTMVEIILATCARIREEFGIEVVTLSGGVFMNALLSSEASQRLQSIGFRVFHHRKVPANDGGLSLGQLAIAAQHEFARDG